MQQPSVMHITPPASPPDSPHFLSIGGELEHDIDTIDKIEITIHNNDKNNSTIYNINNNNKRNGKASNNGSPKSIFGGINPFSPSLSFSNKSTSTKYSICARVFSVRFILIFAIAFLVMFLSGCMYGVATFSQNRITNDLSERVLENVILRVYDLAKKSFAFPYVMARNMLYVLPTGRNATTTSIRPTLYNEWQQSDGAFGDMFWTDLQGNVTGYAVGRTQSGFFELYQNADTIYLYPVIDVVSGNGNRSMVQYLSNYTHPKLEWMKTVQKYRDRVPRWSSVYRDPKFPVSLYLMVCVGIFDEVTNEDLGVASIDLTSDTLANALTTLSISKNAHVWVMEADGTLVVSSPPTPHKPGADLDYAQNSTMKMVRETTNRLLEMNELNSEYTFDYMLDGEKIQAHFYPMQDYNLNMKVIVAYPESDFFGEVRKAQLTMIGVGVGILFFALVFGLVVMYFITVPLTRLGKQMEEIAKGDFDSPILMKHNDTKLHEIKMLQLDFQRMLMALRSFSRFVPVDIVRYLLRSNTEASALINQKELTVMFSDIKGFTTKVEEMSPEQLSLILSNYLNAMCSVIVETKGTVDKFIGDAVMALWNVPTPVENHAVQACTAALLSLSALTSLNSKWSSIGLPIVECRIGIHTGKALVGNMGSKERLAFTAVGDSINLGARLESLNKKYGTTILISGDVYKQVKDLFLCRFLDVVIVCGKTKPTLVYELVSLQSETSDKQRALCFAQGEALNLFLDRKFESAIRIYDRLAEDMPNDVSIKLLTERATAAHQASELPEDWTGYLILEDK